MAKFEIETVDISVMKHGTDNKLPKSVKNNFLQIKNAIFKWFKLIEYVVSSLSYWLLLLHFK